MELGSEVEKERFITLVSPEDELLIRKDGSEFHSKKINIPDLGNLYLWGNREYDYSDSDELGVAIVDNHMVITAARDLDELGFFETVVQLGGLPKSDVPVICKMVLPKYGLNIESEIDFGEDVNEQDPEFRHFGYTEKWKVKDNNKELSFFAPADPNFLSQLRFSFNQMHNPPESPK